MKRIILLFIFMVLFLIPAVAQKGKSSATDTTSVNSTREKALILRTVPRSDFHFQPGDSLRYKKIPRYRLPKQFPDSQRQQLWAEKRSPVDNMPIVVLPKFDFRMPVYKPDSTIDFKLKIKKIERCSPVDK